MKYSLNMIILNSKYKNQRKKLTTSTKLNKNQNKMFQNLKMNYKPYNNYKIKLMNRIYC